MKLLETEIDKAVRDYVTGELSALERAIDGWVDSENENVDQLTKAYPREYFAIAHHQERARAGVALGEIISRRRRALEDRYQSHELKNELKEKRPDA